MKADDLKQYAPGKYCRRQYAACSFTPGGRTYTYHADFPVKVGDQVMAESRDGTKRVTVVEISEEAPRFPTKALHPMPPAAPEEGAE